MISSRCKALVALYGLMIFSWQPVNAQRTAATHLITFFIEKDTEPEKVILPKYDIPKITKPETVDKFFIKKQLFNETEPGIFATYMGWYDVSNNNGQIIFPRKHDENRVQVVVTRSLQPVMSEETLIHHWVAGFAEPVAFYDFSLKTGAHDQEPEWTVKKVQTPPSRIIPLHAVVIIAPPDQILIKEGTFKTFKGGNLILPTLYARRNLTANINSLHFIKVNRFFAPVEFVRRSTSTQYAEMVIS